LEDKSNIYNILPTAGSRLGSLHTAEAIAKMSNAKIGENHPMFGITGENHPLFGKSHTPETILKMSEAKIGNNHPLFGKNHTTLSKAKMSSAKGTPIYVYVIQGTLVNTFSSARKAAEYFNCNHKIILKHAKKGLLFKDQWVLSIKLLND